MGVEISFLARHYSATTDNRTRKLQVPWLRKVFVIPWASESAVAASSPMEREKHSSCQEQDG